MPHTTSTALRRAGILAFAGLCLATAGCASKIDPIAWEADKLTLYSIDGDAPYRNLREDGKPAAQPGETFHGYPVLGKVELTDPAERKTLLRALDRGIKSSDGTVAACFIPRHGISASRGSDTMDYVICFQCLSITTYKNGVRGSELTTASPAQEFNAMLKKHGLPLAP